jgi:large subunit ribosomal protein L39
MVFILSLLFRFKLEQIPGIIAKSGEEKTLTVYKLGDFVDISKGPMISNTSLVGRFEVTGIFDIDVPRQGTLQRVQGVSIPNHLHLHFWTFQFLAQRAAKLNKYEKFIDVKKLNKQTEAATSTQTTV